MAGRLRARRQHQSGAAAVEFALIGSMVFLLLFSMIQYGFYFWGQQAANAAAREGARRVSVGDYAACPGFATFIDDQVGGAGAGPATATRTFTNAPGHTDAGGEPGDEMTVTVSFDSLDIGLIPLPDGGVVVGNAVSRVESLEADTPLAVC